MAVPPAQPAEEKGPFFVREHLTVSRHSCQPCAYALVLTAMCPHMSSAHLSMGSDAALCCNEQQSHWTALGIFMHASPSPIFSATKREHLLRASFITSCTTA